MYSRFVLRSSCYTVDAVGHNLYESKSCSMESAFVKVANNDLRLMMNLTLWPQYLLWMSPNGLRLVLINLFYNHSWHRSYQNEDRNMNVWFPNHLFPQPSRFDVLTCRFVCFWQENLGTKFNKTGGQRRIYYIRGRSAW